MSRHLIIAHQTGAEVRVLDWVWFRASEGVDAFHVVVHHRLAYADAVLEELIQSLRSLGVRATGEVGAESTSRVLRTKVAGGGFAGVILAAAPDRLGRTKRTVERVQRRHHLGVVWVDPAQGLSLRRNESRHLHACPLRDDEEARGAGPKSEGDEAA